MPVAETTAGFLATLQELGLAAPEGALAPFKFVLGIPQEVTVQQILRGTARPAAVTQGAQPMGLASFLGGLARGAVGLFGAAAPVAARAVAPAGRVAGRALQGGVGRALLGGAVGGVAFAGAEALISPDGVPAAGGAAQAAAALGLQPVTTLSGGRVLAATQGGAMVVLSSTGKVIRPQIIVPAGQRLPDGATVVFISADRSQIGITRKRRRRAFATEVNRVRRTLRGCQAVLAAAQPRKRRA